MPKQVYAIEGLDGLGKSTLIEGIRNTLGYYEVIHFSKPVKLDAYLGTTTTQDVPKEHMQAYTYQHAGFLNSMLLARSSARIIFDRWHLGEVTYSPLYRGYSGEYVFEMEKNTGLDKACDIRLILLVEDFAIAKHFIDDGLSLGPIEKRAEEQERFIVAFWQSNIMDKRIICVTNKSTGGFRSKEEILKDAIK